MGIVHLPNELLTTGPLVALGGSDISEDTQHTIQFSIKSSEGCWSWRLETSRWWLGRGHVSGCGCGCGCSCPLPQDNNDNKSFPQAFGSECSLRHWSMKRSSLPREIQKLLPHIPHIQLEGPCVLFPTHSTWTWGKGTAWLPW